MELVKVGIIGIGNMGGDHLKCIMGGKIEGMTVTAVCDIDAAKLRAAKETYPALETYENYEELIEKADADTIIIAVPHPLHAKVGIFSFAHGKNVLTEKPMDISLSAAEQLCAAAKESGKLFGIMLNQRTSKLFTEARRIVQSGELGQLKRSIWIVTNWYRTNAYYASGAWRASWKGEGGGLLLNQAAHNLDLWQWICGMPVSVEAKLSYGLWHDIEVEDDVNTYCEFADGSTGNFITSTGEFPGTNRLEISGTRGRMVFEDGVIKFKRTEVDVNEFCRSTPESFPSMDTWNIVVPTRKDTGHEHQDVIEAFVKAVLDPKAKLVAEGEEGIRSVEFGNAMLYSGLKGEEVSIPMDTVKFDAMLDDLIKNSKFQKKEVKEAIVDMGNSF